MKKLYTILFLLISNFITAQDLHFSQFHAMPLYLNPAMTGFFDGAFRVGLIYRNQWFSIGSPYGKTKIETYGGYADISVLKQKLKGDYLGIGISVARDRAGDLDLTNTDASLSLAYAKTFGRRVKHTLAFGLQGELLMTQFAAGQNAHFSDGIPENIGHSIIGIDMTTGLRYQVILQKRLNFYLGFAYAHISRPAIYALNDKTNRLASKYVAHAGAQIEVSDRFNLLPTVLFMMQGTAIEAQVGANAQFIFGDTYRSHNFFSFGLSARFAKPNGSESLIPNLRLDYQNVGIGIAYDINLSDLTRATSSVGAIEVSLSYTYSNKRNKSFNTLFCPKF